MYKNLPTDELFKKYRALQKRTNEDQDGVVSEDDLALSREVNSRSRNMSEEQYFKYIFED